MPPQGDWPWLPPKEIAWLNMPGAVHGSGRRVGAVAALALATSLVAGPVHAAESTPAVAGAVTLAGEAVEGAVVTLTVLRGLDAPTEPHREVPVASMKTGVDGRFSIPLQVTQQVLDAAAQNGMYVNYLVQAFYDQNVQPNVSDPYNLEPTGKGYSAADLFYTQVINTGVTTTTEELAGYTLSVPDVVTLELTAVSAVDTVGATPNATSDHPCRPYYAPYVTVIGREDGFNAVGEAHANYDMTVRWDYGVHANTDLNGAFSFGGGSWKASTGMSHMGNKRTMTGANYGPFESYIGETVFRYRKEKLEYTDDGGDGRICRTDYRIVPEGWSGASWRNGASMRSKDSWAAMDSARVKGWASMFGRNRFWTKNTARGYKYHAGVEAFGVSLAAQTTWSNQVDLFYQFGSDIDNHWLYGSNAPIVNAQNVYAW